MKKILITLTMVILLGLTACGNKSESSSTGVDAIKEGKPQKITVWCWDPKFNIYAMKEAAKVYEAMYPNITIEVVDIPDNFEGKVEAGFQAGGAGLPDIVLMQDFIIEKFLQNYPGVFVDLQAEGVDFSQFAQYKVGPMTEGNSVYGIPFDSGSAGLFLRTDFIEAAGLNPSDYQKTMTWSEVIQLGEKVKLATGKPLIAIDNTSADTLKMMIQSTGTQLFKDDGSVNFDTLALRKSVEILQEMSNKGLLFHAEGWNNWVSSFNNGESAGMLQALWIIGTLKSNPDNAGKWMVVPTPKIEGVPGAQNATNNGGSSWYVLSGSKNRDIAVDFLKSVWASNTPEALEFYNVILKGAGAMGTYLPSRVGSNYHAPDEFFYMSQPVYKDFAEWMEDVPVFYYTPNFLSMRIALNNALQLIYTGDITNVDQLIDRAEAEYKQTTGN